MRNLVKLAIIGLAVLVAQTASAQEMLQIKGSDTLINLVQKLSEEYMKKYPSNYVAVTGGGSGTGVAALINQKCDIANASRLMKPKEIKMAKDNGVTANRIVIAMDGLSVIVNPENPITQLTKDEIGAIFRGDVKNWSEIGGPDMPINMYGRQSNSGTFVFFQDYVLKGDYSAKMNRMNGNAQIVEAVKSDKSAIGYVGVGYVKDATGLTVVSVASKRGGEYASPLNSADVKSGKYPIARPLNQYVAGIPEGAIRKFLEFELSPEGQRIVEEEGFFPIPSEYEEFNSQVGL